MKTMMAALAAATMLAGPVWAQAANENAEVDRFLAEPPLVPASAAAVTTACDQALALAGRLRTALEREAGTATVDGTLRRFDNLSRVLNTMGGTASLIGEVAPDDARRNAGRACEGRLQDEGTAISLSRPIYQRLKAIDVSRADDTVKLVVKRALAAYERAGVAQDDAGRKAVEAVQAKITADGLAFGANIANGRKVVKARPAELAGLPADYLAAHKPGADGMVEISTDTPDYVPVMTYATDAGLRRRLMEAYLTRAPNNDPVLKDMLAQRDTLARMLGRPNFATLALEDKMIDSPAKSQALLDQLSTAADAPARRDYARMMDRLRRIDPAATTVPPWSSGYVQQLIRKEAYSVDPQEVRRYFAYDNVRDGILRLSEDLFGVQIRPWQTALWDPSVEAYEMVDGGQVIGRFYLDTHPRPGKYTHANVVPVRFGLDGRAIPIGALVTNFPAGKALMEHRDVETFLHEFGHMLHLMFSGRQAWEGASMLAVEWDFVEAPSQMLEEWVWDYETLSRFAKDEQGRTIPRDLVDKMRRARSFAEAFGHKRQFGLANVSLGYHLGPPAQDLSAAYRQLDNRYSLIPMPDTVSPQNSFGHLSGYSAYYHTYMWSLVIANDLFTAFEKAGLRDPATARRYRELVLAKGSSKPAATLVADFLGRPVSLDAYKARLAEGE